MSGSPATAPTADATPTSATAPGAPASPLVQIEGLKQGLPHQGRRPAAHGGRGARRGRRGPRDPPRRDAGPRRRVGLRQDHDRPAAAAAHRAHRRPHRLRRHGHHDPAGQGAASPTGGACRSSSRIPSPRWTRASSSATASARACASTTSARPPSGARRSPTIMDLVGLQPYHARPLPPRVQRRAAAAHRHRPGPRPGAGPHRLRRAGVRAGRLHPGPGAQPAEVSCRRSFGPDLPLHRPQPGRRGAHQRPRGGHVPGPRGRADRPGAALPRPAPPLHDGAHVGHPAARPDACGASASS